MYKITTLYKKYFISFLVILTRRCIHDVSRLEVVHDVGQLAGHQLLLLLLHGAEADHEEEGETITDPTVVGLVELAHANLLSSV